MRFAIVGLMLLLASGAEANDRDAKIDRLNLCMYKNGMLFFGLVNPAGMRKAIVKICETELNSLINTFVPKDPEGKISIDVEGAERDFKKASQSKLVKYVVDTFVENYAKALKQAK
jgi:multimeric flavodoxin WrbA